MINNKYKIGDEVFYLEDNKNILFKKGIILAINIDELGICYTIRAGSNTIRVENISSNPREEKYILGLVNEKSDYFSVNDAKNSIETNISNMIIFSENEIKKYIEERNLKLVDSIKQYIEKHKMTKEND